MLFLLFLFLLILFYYFQFVVAYYFQLNIYYYYLLNVYLLHVDFSLMLALHLLMLNVNIQMIDYLILCLTMDIKLIEYMLLKINDVFGDEKNHEMLHIVIMIMHCNIYYYNYYSLQY
eukprot:747729_1